MPEATAIHITKKVHQELLHLIATSLVLRNENGKGWHYHLMVVDGSNSGLATYLGLSNDDWMNIMLFCGLARLYGNSIGIDKKQWDMLLSSAGLPTIILDRTQVGKATDIVGLQKRQFWIHLGKGNDNAINQFKSKGRVPRIIQCKKMKECGLRMNFFVNLFHEMEIERCKKESLEAERSHQQQEQYIIDDEEGSGQFIDADEAANREINKLMKSKVQLEPLRYPHLASMPNLSVEVIYSIQREIRLIRSELDLPCDYKVGNTNTTRYMPVIPKVSSSAAFRKHASGMIIKVVKSMVTQRRLKELKQESMALDHGLEENEPIDCELLAEKECAQWILELLGRMYTDEFVRVGQMQKLNWSNTRMDGPTAAAMWSEANVSVYQQRIIRRYLVAIFGFCMIVPEAKIRGLVQDDIPPEAKKFVTNDGETIHYYVKPMDLILKTVIDDLVVNSDHMMLEALTFMVVDTSEQW